MTKDLETRKGEAEDADGSIAPILLAIAVALGAVVGLFYLAPTAAPVAPEPTAMATASARPAPGPDSIPTMNRPPGFGAYGVSERATDLAEKHSIEELINKWRAVPEDSELYAGHADYARALGAKVSDGGLDPEAARSVARALAPYAGHQNPTLRRGALAGLSGSGDEGLAAMVSVLQSLASPADSVRGTDARRDVIGAIGEMAPQAAGAVDVLLQRLQSDGDRGVRRGAAEALGNIGPAAAAALEQARSTDGGVATAPDSAELLDAVRRALQHVERIEEMNREP